jgi:hypothetical protein
MIPAMAPSQDRLSRLLPLVLVLCAIFVPQTLSGYSVLTHEQIVDLAWKDQIEPLLEHRFPDATPEDIKKAHAFAYGGSLIQDMGYYPFGNKEFSDLLHYVRSGDFVANLLHESTNLNEYAFALGALAHYASDNAGHPTINRVVAIEFPRLGKKHGESVTYADDPKAHIRTEFGFDMVQVAKNRYTSDRYHDFIGFEIASPVLDRAFQDTYGIPLKDIIPNEDLAYGTFRFAVSQVIPEMTRVALLARRKEIVADTPNFHEKQFLYYLSRADYEKEWGTTYRRPGVGARMLAVVLRIIPKVGPFSALAFKIPTTQTEDMYIQSVDHTVQDYHHRLEQVRHGTPELSNRDCDTGRETRAGEYILTDKSYASLLGRLAAHGFNSVTPDLKSNIVSFYGDLNAPIATKRNRKAWKKTVDQLARLKAAEPTVARDSEMPKDPASSRHDNEFDRIMLT